MGTTCKLVLLAGTAMLSQAALAQESSPATDKAPGDIIVTAAKRSERLLDTPQSVTAITADDLARLNATEFRDFASTVPGLSFTTAGAGQTQVSLRGVTAGVDIGPTVGIYVDDVPYGSSSAFANSSSLALDVGLFDLDRIEVLRGPQGTLYGAGAMGGVLKYITRTPDLGNFAGTGRAGLSFTDHGGTNYDAAAAINAPIVQDKLALRASGFYNRTGGYVDNVALGEDNVDRARVYGGRLDLLFKPADDLTVRITGFGQNIDRDGTPAADFTLSGQPVDGELQQRRLTSEPFEQRFRLISGTVSYDFGPASLTSISSYQTVRSQFRQDASAVYVPVLAGFGLPFSAVAVDQGRSTDKFTQEVRLASSSGGFVEWLAGGYYTHETSRNTQLIVPYDATGAIAPINLATVSIPSRYEEIAGFGNVTLHLTHSFDVTGGIRYAENRQRFEQVGSGLLIGSTPETRAKDDVVTWLGNARYHFSRHAMIYARYATGYRPGGPNFVVNDPTTGQPLASSTFRSDSLQSFEGGFKAETADRTFSIDAAGYHIDWKNIQVSTAAGGVSVIANADNGAKIDGAELTLTARPIPAVTVTGAFAYQDAKLKADEPLLGGRKGERLPNVPKFTAALNADWQLATEGLRPTLGGTLRFISDRSASFDTSAGFPQYKLPDYTTIDLRAGVAVGPVDAQIFVRNLFDERGQLSAQTFLSVAGGPAQVTILQPRTIGLSASTRF